MHSVSGSIGSIALLDSKVSKPAIQKWNRFLLQAICMLLLCYGGYRTLYQDVLLNSWLTGDFRPVYLSTRAWLTGNQPYDPSALILEARQADQALYQSVSNDIHGQVAIYPPSMFPALAFLSAMPWGLALAVDLALSAIAYFAMIWLCSLRLTGLKRLYFIAFAAASAPFHGAFSCANVSALVVPLACVSILCVDSNPIFASVLLGAAVAIKPPVAALFILYLAITRRWKPFMLTMLTSALLFGVGIGWMKWHHLSWLAEYRANVATLVSPLVNKADGVVWNGAANFRAFNIQPVFYLITHSLNFAIIASYILLIALLVALSWSALSRPIPLPSLLDSELLSVACLCTFIAVYQHYYSAMSLLLVVLWALQAWPRFLAKCVVAGASILILPLSKLPVMVMLIRDLLKPGFRISFHSLFRHDLPSDIYLGLPEQIAFMFPICLVVICAVALTWDCWRIGRVSETEIDTASLPASAT